MDGTYLSKEEAGNGQCSEPKEVQGAQPGGQPEDEEREKTGLSGKSKVRDLLKDFLFCFGGFSRQNFSV